MINIISQSVISKRVRGPKKVVDNLISGLDIINEPYVINKALDSTNKLWIHDDPEALSEAMRLQRDVEIIAGPNIYLEPKNIPNDIDVSRFKYIQPCEWAKNRWLKLGYTGEMIVWPVGIDTEKYKQTTEERNSIMVYFKARTEEQLDFVIDNLKKANAKYTVFKYGYYKELEYRKALAKTTFIIWIGSTETQGVALEEAMSTGIPLLVWDIKTVGEALSAKDYSKEHKNIEGTSVPYFNEECGIVFYNKDDFSNSLNQMLTNWKNFNPRKYIIENLSLQKTAKDFTLLFNNQNQNTVLKNNKNWKNKSILFLIKTRLKDLIKNIINR